MQVNHLFLYIFVHWRLLFSLYRYHSPVNAESEIIIQVNPLHIIVFKSTVNNCLKTSGSDDDDYNHSHKGGHTSQGSGPFYSINKRQNLFCALILCIQFVLL